MDLRRPFAACAALAMVGGGLLLGSLPAAATTACTVVNERTGFPSSDLQAAIQAASPGDTLSVHGTCVGHFVIAKDLTLVGGATLDGNHTQRPLTVDAGNVLLRQLTIANGTAGDGSAGGGDLYVHSSATLRGVTLKGGEAFANGGGLYVDDSGDASLHASRVNGNFADGGLGGGIYSTGRLRVFGSAITGNLVGWWCRHLQHRSAGCIPFDGEHQR